MIDRIVVDAGPLVALLRQDDQHHKVCRVVSADLRPPLHTTWLAITEAAWLLRRVPGGVEQLIELLDTKLVVCHEPGAGFVPWLKEFFKQYSDLQPQVADGSLVFLADLLGTDVIFTLDRRDFVVFRKKDGKPFRLLPENL